jgi:hypothetical protein
MAKKQLKLKPIYAVKIPNFPNAWLVGAIPEQKSAAWPILYKDRQNDITMIVAPKNGEWRIFVLDDEAEMMFPDQLLTPENFKYNFDKDIYIATDGKQVAIMTGDKDKMKRMFNVEPTYKVRNYHVFIGKCSDIPDFDTIFKQMEVIQKIREDKKAGMRNLV